jgi:hypothetical protein
MFAQLQNVDDLPPELLRSKVTRYLDVKDLSRLKVASARLCTLTNDAATELCARLTGLSPVLVQEAVNKWSQCEDLRAVDIVKYDKTFASSSTNRYVIASSRSLSSKKVFAHSALVCYVWLQQRLEIARMPFAESDYGGREIHRHGSFYFSRRNRIDYGAGGGAKPCQGCSPHGRINVGADPYCPASVSLV